MGIPQTLEAARGWLELGLPDEALAELESIRGDFKTTRAVLEIKLAAQMHQGQWNTASDTARMLCMKANDEPRFFLRAAFCLHETGDTFAACNWLLKGPRSLHDMAIFHYNMACYLSVLGKAQRAKVHLNRALDMDERLREEAGEQKALAGIESGEHRVE